MRNDHTFDVAIECRCPYDNCGKTFTKDVTVKYVTNQKGDVIEEFIT